MYFCDPVDSGTLFEDIVFVLDIVVVVVLDIVVVVVDPYIQI